MNKVQQKEIFCGTTLSEFIPMFNVGCYCLGSKHRSLAEHDNFTFTEFNIHIIARFAGDE